MSRSCGGVPGVDRSWVVPGYVWMYGLKSPTCQPSASSMAWSSAAQHFLHGRQPVQGLEQPSWAMVTMPDFWAMAIMSYSETFPERISASISAFIGKIS